MQYGNFSQTKTTAQKVARLNRTMQYGNYACMVGVEPDEYAGLNRTMQYGNKSHIKSEIIAHPV